MSNAKVRARRRRRAQKSAAKGRNLELDLIEILLAGRRFTPTAPAWAKDLLSWGLSVAVMF